MKLEAPSDSRDFPKKVQISIVNPMELYTDNKRINIYFGE